MDKTHVGLHTFYHPITNSLWEAGTTQWVWHGGISQCTHQQWFHVNGAVETPPPVRELQKASVARHGQKLCLTGYNECIAIKTNFDFCQKL